MGINKGFGLVLLLGIKENKYFLVGGIVFFSFGNYGRFVFILENEKMKYFFL